MCTLMNIWTRKNKSLFGAAQEGKRTLNFKYKSGLVHIRKTDDSEMIAIYSTEDIQTLEW